jgi:tight adherence protein B
MRIKGEIRTLTAQQRLSGYVVAFLPIGILAFLFVIAPKFLEPLWDSEVAVAGIPVGVILMGMGGLSMFVGFMIIRRIVDIEV